MKSKLFALLLQGCLLGGTCVAGEDFHDKNLTKRDFTGKVLDEADFSGATLTNAKFEGASLKGANFQDASMSTAVFRGADMTGANMGGLKVPGGIFERTNLSKSKWDGSVLQGASKTNYQEADLRKAKLGPYFFNNCDFQNADLRGANLRAPELRGLNHCLWKGAKYDDETAFPDGFDPKFEGMVYSKTEVRKAEPKPVPKEVTPSPSAATGTPGKDFTGKELPGAKFEEAMLNRAAFDRANLEGANFSNALLKGASFKGANLKHVRFTKANLEGADFTGAKLQRANFVDARAWNAIFVGTEIHLLRATLDDAKAEEILGQFADKSNGTLSFRYSDMRNAVILGDVGEVDFRWTDLRGANLSGARNLEAALFKGAKYDSATRWTLDAEKAGAILVKGEAPQIATAPLKAVDMKGATPVVNSPFVGTWSVYKDIGDPKTAGELRIAADGSIAWQPLSSETAVLAGKWSSPGDNLLAVAGGELGKAWSVRRIVRPSGKCYLELKTGDGDSRIALPK